MEKISAAEWSAAPSLPPVRLRCPFCRHRATFDAPNTKDVSVGGRHLAVRRCPNPDCYAAVFVVTSNTGNLQASFPPEVIDFDTTDLPEPVLAALSEAVRCHAAGCYRAAAIMVRRTLEDLCADRGAVGGNLKERVTSLSSKVVLPTELLDGLDALRLLGNDAAHIEAQAYADVGQDEVELAIDVSKEVLKAVYQYGSLVQRLNNLKRQPSDA